MKQFKTQLMIALLGTLVGANALANTVQATCTVSDERFISTTSQTEINVQNILGEQVTANFANAPKRNSIVTNEWVTLAFSNDVDNYYSFSLNRADVEQALASGQAPAYAEVRYTNVNTKPYEQYLRDGQMLKMHADCVLEIVQ